MRAISSVITLLVVVSGVVAGGCGTPPLCRLGAETIPSGASIDSFERRIFEQLLLAPATTDSSDLELSCVGEPTRFPDLPSRCTEREELGTLLPSSSIGPDDVTVEPAEGDYWLAYLPVRRYSGGMSEGPVAIIRRNGDIVEVRALGILRVYPGRVGLRLERVGENVVLFADGEHCSDGEATCARSTRLLLLVGQRLEAAHVASPTVACVGPALFARQETRIVRISERVEHIFERTLGLDVVDGSIRVAEDIVVNERVDGAAQTRVVRRSDATITIAIDAEHGRFVAEGTSRWSSLILDATSLGRSR